MKNIVILFKKIFTFKILFISLCCAWLVSSMAFGWSPVRFFTSSGEMSKDGIKIFRDTFTVSQGDGTILDISAAGYSSSPVVTINAEYNTADSMQVPNIAIKSISPTQIIINITEGNPVVINVPLLSLNVLSGPPVRFIRNKSIKIHVAAIGK